MGHSNNVSNGNKPKKTKRGPRKDEKKTEKPKPVQPKLIPTKKGTMPKILDKANPWGAPSKLNKKQSIPKNPLKPVKQNKNKKSEPAKRQQKKKKSSIFDQPE